MNRLPRSIPVEANTRKCLLKALPVGIQPPASTKGGEQIMKFLVTSQTRDSYYTLPTKKRMEFTLAGDAYIRKYLKSGRCKEAFSTCDLKGSVSIWELGSSEEAALIMLENPIQAYVDMDIQPIMEHDVLVKTLMAYKKKEAKSKRR